MVNLLKNRKIGGTSNKQNISASLDLGKQNNQEIQEDEERPVDLNKVNISRYKDPYGLSIGGMKFGLWLISNRRNFLSALLALLILISFVSWSFFLYAFGSYIFKGMKIDQGIINSFSEILIPDRTIKNISAIDLEFGRVKIFNLGSNKYDFLVKISNPNKKYFVHFDYYFKGGDKKIGYNSSFILPDESKYIMSLGVLNEYDYKNFNLVLTNLRWERITNKNFPNWESFSDDRLDIKVLKKDFSSGQKNNLSDKVNLNKLNFEIKNDTAYNYWKADFNIILFGNNGEVASNIYQVDNFMSEEIVQGEIVWPGSLPNIKEILIMPDIDITENDIYINIDGSGGQTK